MKTFTLQDLKDNKEQIIAYANMYNFVPLKKYMQYLKDLVDNDMAEGETFEDFYTAAYDFLRPRSRKTTQHAEAMARLVEEGKIEEYDQKKYWNNKLSK